MREIKIEELKEILESHKKWLNGEGGERADLSNADLSYADLRNADLSNANGNMKEIKSIRADTYHIAYTATVMQIGCERHDIKDWFEFDNARILQMDGKKALTFWRKWKPLLMQIIEYNEITKTEAA